MLMSAWTLRTAVATAESVPYGDIVGGIKLYRWQWMFVNDFQYAATVDNRIVIKICNKRSVQRCRAGVAT